MPHNVLVIHGGAPTAVMNVSLCGVIREAKASPLVGKIWGAAFGMGGALREDFCDLSSLSEETLKALSLSPASAIGTSRDAVTQEEYERFARILKKYDIRTVLFNGGNGTMDACGKSSRVCRELGIEAAFVGIPKTVDNDIAVTDHSPGYGSAARYIAACTREICADVRSMPIHVCIVECMGRNAGWLTAASALARQGEDSGPDLIYLPEQVFSVERFLEDALRVWKKGRGVVAVVSEGVHGPDGEPLVEPVFHSGRSVYYGDVSAYLARLVIERLGIKARSEKPGILCRASAGWQSETDREEAEQMGREAVRAALRGESDVMMGLRRLPGEKYGCESIRIPLEEVALVEKKLPKNYVVKEENYVTEEFIRWCRPLLGSPLRDFVRLV